MPLRDQRREKIMSQADFEALRETLYAAAGTMSREQIIELADDLFEYSRARRELHSWRPKNPAGVYYID